MAHRPYVVKIIWRVSSRGRRDLRPRLPPFDCWCAGYTVVLRRSKSASTRFSRFDLAPVRSRINPGALPTDPLHRRSLGAAPPRSAPVAHSRCALAPD
jgi:hypothetical protein